MNAEQLKASVRIEDVIGRRVKLSKIGDYFSGLCPFHEEKRQSFKVFPNAQRFDCFGCGEGGSVIDFITKLRGCTVREAMQIIQKGGDLSDSQNTPGNMGAVKAERNVPSVAYPPIDWLAYVGRIKGEHIRRLHKWRGYSLPFCQWLASSELFGVFRDCIAFPVTRDGQVISAHVRGKTNWFYTPKGRGVEPWVIKPDTSSEDFDEFDLAAHIFESEWDMLSAMDQMHQQEGVFAMWICTRGACNAHKTRSLGALPAIRYVYPQNDAAGEKWLGCIEDHFEGTNLRLRPMPDGVKDANDAVKKGIILSDL